MKKKAVKYFICFLIVMLICTVFSRGIYAGQMPIVDVDRPESKSIVHAIEIDGSVTSQKEIPVIVQQGIRVESVQAQVGQQVDTGEVLLTLSVDDLKDLADTLQAQIDLEQQKLSDYTTNNNHSKELKDRAVTRAEEDVTNTINSQNAEVTAAQQEYDAAVQELADFPTQKEYLKQNTKKTSGSDGTAGTEQEATGQTGTEQTATENEAALTSEWQTKKSTLEQAVLEKKTQLDTAVSAREEAVRQANRTLEDAKNPDGAEDSATLTELEQQLETDKSTLTQYQKLIEQQGQVTSETAGVISKLLITPGERTVDGAAILMEDEEAGLYFTGTLATDQREYVSRQDEGSLSLQNGKVRLPQTAISSIAPQEDGTYQVSVPIESADVSVGDVGTLTITQQSQDYACCVPLSALFADNGDTYVLVIEETNTFLGTELSVRKVVVQVADKDYEMAALQDAPLTQEDRVVTASDRAIFSGDKVRLMEADE